MDKKKYSTPIPVPETKKNKFILPAFLAVAFISFGLGYFFRGGEEAPPDTNPELRQRGYK